MRGKTSRIGDTRTSPNGYHYTRTSTGWRTTHTIVAEKKIGRPLAQNERVKFKNKDKNDLRPENLEVYVVKEGSKAKQKAQLRAKIADLQARLEELEHDES